MPKVKKTSTKKEEPCQHEKALAELKKAGDKLSEFTKNAMKKFEQADDKTKKSIIAGIAGAVALVAGAIGAKKMMDKKKK